MVERSTKAEWPRKQIVCGQDVHSETKITLICNRRYRLMGELTKLIDSRLDPSRWSSWLTHVLAWVLRFLYNCRSMDKDRHGGPLTPGEITDAENFAIRQAQRDGFCDEYLTVLNGKPLSKGSRLLKLTPRIDDDGLLRADGRLSYAEFLSLDLRFPIILPRGHWVTKLIVKHFHELGKHITGTNHTLSNLSSKYWIVAPREEIREWEQQCNECKRRQAKVATQVMAPLPVTRLRNPLRAFHRVSVDFGGPFITVQGRGKRREKRRLCLFTCLLSRAIHLEMAYGLDTDSFLRCLMRMTCRRGNPQEIISDPGTNFVGAA